LGWAVWGSNLGGGGFSALLQIGPGAHSTSCTMGTGSFPGVRWPEHGIDLPPYLVRAKQSPYRPRGFQEVEAPRFQDSWDTNGGKVGPTHRLPLPPPQEIFLVHVLISVRG